jgi:hypothetical protein
MKIDLMAMAQKAEETYLDVECSFGNVRVYHIPDAVLLSASIGRPEPELPMIAMRTATGTQERPSKKGDEVYEDWLVEKAEYDSELFQLRNATATVLSLKDIPYPDISKPPTSLAETVYNGKWPDNEMLRKKIWLDFTILARRDDQNKILNALNEMNGQNEPSDEMVDEVKKNSV